MSGNEIERIDGFFSFFNLPGKFDRHVFFRVFLLLLTIFGIA